MLQCPHNLLHVAVTGWVEVGGVGVHTCVFFVGALCVNKGDCILFLGGGTVVAGGAHHDEDIPLFEGHLVPVATWAFYKAVPT